MLGLNIECGKRLKECIKEAEITQRELADQTGFTQQYISYIVRGKKPMTDRAAKLFAKYLHVREDYLLCVSGLKVEENKMFCPVANGYQSAHINVRVCGKKTKERVEQSTIDYLRKVGRIYAKSGKNPACVG